MTYPESWKCPSCGSIVYNSNKCNTCNYKPPSESGGLEIPKAQAKIEKAPKKKGRSVFMDRIIAFLIDCGILASMGALIGLMIALIMGSGSEKKLSVLFPLFGVPTILVFLALHPVYFWFLEGIYAQTYGKQLMNLKVSHPQGMTLMKSFLRNVTRFIEVLLLYILSIILIKKNGQRLGDRLAGTTVIRA